MQRVDWRRKSSSGNQYCQRSGQSVYDELSTVEQMKHFAHLPFVLAVLLFGNLGCSRKSDSAEGQHHETMTTFVTLKPLSTITNAAPFRATVVSKQIEKRPNGDGTIASVELRMPDKTVFAIGQSRATPIEIEFLSTLEVGREYSFPDVFTEWEKQR